MSEGKLYIKDTRTWKDYEIDISRNSVNAADFRKIVAPAGDSDPAHRVHKGLRLFDPGYNNTATHETKITWADGAKARLLFRGHDSQDLWDCSFEEMLHLLVWGSLPSDAKREEIRAVIAETACSVPETVYQTIRSFPNEAPTMTMMLAGMAAYLAAEPTMIPSYNAGNTYHRNAEMCDLAVLHTVAVYGVVAGVAYSHRKRQEFRRPTKDATFWENLLCMLGHVDENGNANPLHHEVLRHVGSFAADHDLTNSALSMLVSASSLADPISCLMSAMCSGYGPLHLGACESGYKTMEKLGGPENVHHLINRVTSGKQRLYGYGHAVLRTVDPRIVRMKKLIDMMRAESNTVNPVLETALEIDRQASAHEYFIKRNLHANVDLYAGFLGIALGFPADFIPTMMVCFRLPGYVAHWRESMDRDIKIMRPLGMYNGPTEPVKVAPKNGEVDEATIFDGQLTPLNNSSTDGLDLLKIDAVLTALPPTTVD